MSCFKSPSMLRRLEGKLVPQDRRCVSASRARRSRGLLKRIGAKSAIIKAGLTWQVAERLVRCSTIIVQRGEVVATGGLEPPTPAVGMLRFSGLQTVIQI